VAVTESQLLSEWLFLLPGDYTLELNGSSLSVSLEKGSQHVINPAFIKVSTPPETDLELAQAIQGSPLFVEINGGHWLNLNEVYPVLPGSARLRLMGSEFNHEVELEGGKLTEKKARAVRVDLQCPPWDWTCLGGKKVYLYSKDAHYAFAEGVTDVPLLYFEDEAWLTLEGTREIRYLLPKSQENTVLKTARLMFKPVPDTKAGVVTDLVRIESINAGFDGNTYDLSLESPSVLNLIPGSYNVAIYNSVTAIDGERRKNVRRVDLSPFEQVEVELVVYLPEKKFKALQKNNFVQHDPKRANKRKLATQKYRAPRPMDAM
jgi:hypothetical protein